MGVLAIKAMNMEGQVGNAAITRAALNSAAGVDFATELECKLQRETNPTSKSGASESNPAPGVASPGKDGNQGQPVAGPSVESLAAIVAEVIVNARSNSPAGNKPTPNPGQAARVSSDNATSVSPEIASTQASGPPQAVATGQEGSAPVTGLAPKPVPTEAPHATSRSSLGKELESAGMETLAPLRNVATQLKQQDRPRSPGASARQRAESGPESQSRAPAARGANARISAPGQQSRDFSQPVPFQLTKAISASPRTGVSQDRDSKAALAETSSTLQPSRPALAVATGQEGSAPMTGSAPTSEGMEALHATSVSSLRNESQSAEPETLVPLQNVKAQLKQQDPSIGPEARARQAVQSGPGSQSDAHDAIALKPQISTLGQQSPGFSQPVPFELTKAVSTSSKAVTSQDKDSKPVLAEASSTLQPSSAASSVITGKDESVPMTGSAPTSEGMEALHATNVSSLGNESQGAGPETLVPLQNVKAQLKQQDPSSGPEARAPQRVESSPESQSSAHDAIGPNAQISTQSQQSPDFSQPVPFQLTKAVSTSSKAMTFQDKDSKPALTEASSTLQPSSAASSVKTGKDESVPMTGSVPTSEGMEALHATSVSSLGKESQGAGPETLAPLQNETTQLKQQGPSGGPEARARQTAESSPIYQSCAHDAIGPNAQISTPGQQSPDFSLSTPFELTKAVSTGRVDEPPNSNRIKNSQEGNRTGSGANSDAEPGGTTASLLAQPANTDGIETGSLVNDTQQADTSAEKQGGEAAQDLTKVANERGGLPKADADPPLAQQLVPQGRAEAGSAFPEAAGASRSRGQAGSASVSEGSQVNAEGVVSSAHFTQQAGNAEMQVRLRSEALGPIDVHTIAKGSTIGASIRVEARDTQVLLANELSQLERALNERSLRVEHLDVLQGSASGGRSDGTGPGNYHGSPSEPRQSFASYSSGQTYTSLPEAPTVSEDWGLGLSSTRINLRV